MFFMPSVSSPGRGALRGSALGLALLLGACSGDLGPSRGYGLLASAPKGPEAPDFVAASRKADETFLPVGVSAPPRPVRAKSAEAQKALEAELEGVRARNAARGRAAESAGRAVAPASP